MLDDDNLVAFPGAGEITAPPAAAPAWLAGLVVLCRTIVELAKIAAALFLLLLAGLGLGVLLGH